MIKTKEEIADEYISLICDFYPGRATLWGYKKLGFDDFNLNYEEKKINGFLNFLKELEEYDDELISLIRKDVSLRIFEIKQIKKHSNRAYFFYEITIKTLMVLWQTQEYFIENKVDSKVLNSRLNLLPNKIDLAIKDMKSLNFSLADLLYTKNSVKKDLKFLEKELKKYDDEKVYKYTINKVKEFEKYIEERIFRNDKKLMFFSYGKDKFKQWINYESQIDIDLEYFYCDAKNFVLNEKLDCGEKVNLNSDINEYIIEKLKEIYLKGKEYFGENKELFSTLNIFNARESGKFGYLPSQISNMNKTGILMCSLDSFTSNESSLIFKLIHEVYPGHHNMFLFNFDKRCTNAFEKVHQNIFYLEGWAKYCEFYYAYNIYKTDIMINQFKTNLSLIALMYIITMDIHFYSMNYSEILNKTLEISGLKKEKVIWLIIECYMNPIYSCSYFIGFNIIKKIYHKMNFKNDLDFHNNILENRFFNMKKGYLN